MEKQNIVFKKKKNIETNEYKIYCNNREISGYEEIMSIIIRNRNEKFTFEGFTKFEIMGIKEVIINYISYLRSLSRKKEYTKVTHILTYDDKRTFYLSTENSNDLDYIEISEFKDINKIEFISYNKEFKMIEVSVEGTICLYGIKNEYGF